MRVDILSLLAGALAGLFAGHAIARGDPSSSQADGGAGTLQVLSSLATSNRINNQVLAGIGELKVLRGGGGGAAAGGEKVTGAQVAAAVKAAVAEAMREQSTLAGSSSALAAAAAVEAAAPCPAIPACPACPVQQPCPKCEAAATVTTAVAAENAGGGVGTDNVGADGTAINFASPFANQPGTIHELGCRRVGAGETQCTDKVGGNTADHKFARVPETGLGAPHGYDRWYEPMFRHLRQRKIRLLEIGMKDGASAHLWTKYFPQAEVFGLDYDPTQAGAQLTTSRDGVRVAIGDQANVEDLAKMLEQTGGRFDIIVDDGGHAPTQQLVSFDFLFRHALKPGGIYSIEDVETSYWTNADIYSFHVEAGLHKRGTAMEVFKQLADSVNRVYMADHDLPQGMPGRFSVFRSGVDTLVDSVQFTANLVLMTKKGVWGAGWDERNQQNMYTAHLSTVDKAVHDTLGEAVDSIDKTLATQKALLNDHVLPSAY